MTEITQLSEHLACYNNDRSDRTMIEFMKFPKGIGYELQMCYNEVVCIIDGKIKYKYQDFPQYEMQTGEITFLPAAGFLSFNVLLDSTVVALRLDEHIQLCENYQVERLYGKLEGSQLPPVKEIIALKINPRIQHYLNGLIDCLNDGVRCKYFFELKIKEFFHLLFTYYTEEEIHNFLSLIVSGDMVFSEYVRKNWRKCHTVEELAGGIYMSSKQFSKKFKVIFGHTAYNWMKKSKAQSIRREITAGNKPFKLIAAEYDFSSITTFAKFCKKELGETPLRLRKGG